MITVSDLIHVINEMDIKCLHVGIEEQIIVSYCICHFVCDINRGKLRVTSINNSVVFSEYAERGKTSYLFQT